MVRSWSRRPPWLRWRGLAERTQVERVDLYTRQSLYFTIWIVPISAYVASWDELDYLREQPQIGVALLIATVLLVTAGIRVLSQVSAHYLRGTTLTRATLVPFLVLGGLLTGVSTLLPEPVAGVVSVSVWSSLAWALGGLTDRRALAALLAGIALVSAAATREPLAVVFAVLVGVFFAFTVRISLWLLGVVVELERARDTRAALAVAEERLRFSRDVHDVLGRHLSTIAVQSELAATLAKRNEATAGPQMLEVRAVAHQALRETRELARGYRATDLTHELDGARSLLSAAGIDVHLDVDRVPESWHEAAAWVVREGVTNVLRHSAATEVTIRYAEGQLTIRNDGVRGASSGGTAPPGSGLTGLAERLHPLGGDLDVTRAGGTFELVASLA